MINLDALTDVVKSPSAARILGVLKTAVSSLTRTFVTVQDDFSDMSEEAPTELRTVVQLQIVNARLRVEVAILSVTVVGAGICAADFALKVIEAGLDYNVSLGDRDRLLDGIQHLFEGATEIHPEGYEDSLCFRLPPYDLDA